MLTCSAADVAAPARSLGGVGVSRQTRAIIISPHPDDGVLGAGGLIQRIVQHGGSVEIVEMTSGDAFPKGVAAVRHASTPPTADAYRWYGSLREHEVLQAMKQLRVARTRVRLLGFPDEGMCQLAADHGAQVAFASPYTHRDSPPGPERMLAGARYRGADARKELEDLFVAFRPNLIVAPDAHDEHPDHCATHLLVHDAIAGAIGRGIRPPRVLHYLIHYGSWPVDVARFPPQDAFKALHLSAAERDRKRQALSAYRTQMTVMSDFIAAFETVDERLIVDDHEVSAACWCGGTNIAPRTSTGRSHVFFGPRAWLVSGAIVAGAIAAAYAGGRRAARREWERRWNSGRREGSGWNPERVGQSTEPVVNPADTSRTEA